VRLGREGDPGELGVGHEGRHLEAEGEEQEEGVDRAQLVAGLLQEVAVEGRGGGRLGRLDVFLEGQGEGGALGLAGELP
jgi:hypothetical protein